jgi:hypothetical protein
MYFGCTEATCDKLKCFGGFADCNQNIDTDGCEANLGEDPANCGACGKACEPGQFCENGSCKCTAAETKCSTEWGFDYCANLDEDRSDCGACGHFCPFVDYPAKSVCHFGRCEIECAAGTADCDGKTENGCEALVDADPQNCGGCGIQCDLSIGQPCVHGACLQGPCDGGVPQ